MSTEPIVISNVPAGSLSAEVLRGVSDATLRTIRDAKVAAMNKATHTYNANSKDVSVIDAEMTRRRRAQ